MEGIKRPEDQEIPSASAVASSGITHFYGNLKTVDNVSMEVDWGESVAILGPSGAGKSTFLRLALGVEHPSQGHALIKLKPSEVGAAFQEDSLLPWLNVTENICLLHKIHEKPIAEDRLAETFKSAGLEAFKDYFPWQLSTGMKQKVALLRLLLYSPRFYVLDEAMANIDDFSRFSLCDAFYSRVVNLESSVLFITHNLMDALHMADRILVCSERPLHITQEFINPLSRKRDYNIRFTAEFQQALEKLRSCIAQL
jgi:NitT/TauT family transport system ATP-binding protein